jgi:hypothetical protein
MAWWHTKRRSLQESKISYLKMLRVNDPNKPVVEAEAAAAVRA